MPRRTEFKSHRRGAPRKERYVLYHSYGIPSGPGDRLRGRVRMVDFSSWSENGAKSIAMSEVESCGIVKGERNFFLAWSVHAGDTYREV